MSGNVILDDFFEFEVHFSRFVTQMAFFTHIKSAHFYIFDPEFTRIAYKYNYLEEYLVEFKEIRDNINKAQFLEKTTNVEYSIIKADDNEKADMLIINIYNPILKDVLVSSVFIYLEDVYDIDVLKVEFNEYYLEELCHHIQMAIANYDKLYYIIDVYTELLMYKDKFMPYHMSNVANWCIKIGGELGISDKEQTLLYVAALLHDVGKLFISDEIINKPGKLTVEEYTLVKHHSEKGEQIIRASLYGMSLLHEVPNIIRHHHEHYDGSGYPDNLEEEAIPYLSRILKVADTVDAMLSRRLYKEAFSYNDIILELAEYSGRQFDPIIADAMIRVIDNYIDTIEASTLFETKFIAQASLTFYYENFNQIVTYNGNLVIRKNIGHFLVHESSLDMHNMDIANIYRSTISFFSMNDFVEYKVNIDSVLEDKFYINSFTFLPTDKLFSLVWKGTVFIENSEGNSEEFELVKLGGDSVVIQMSIEKAAFFLVEPMQQLNVLIKEQIDEINVSFKVGVRILKYYKTNMSYVFVLKYLELFPGDRDRLIRLLFRKQIEQKKSKKQIIEKNKSKKVINS